MYLSERAAAGSKKTGFKKKLFSCMAIIAVLTVTGVCTPVWNETVYADKTEEQSEVYYIGKATRGVNVRIGAGESYDKLKYNGSDVSIPAGTEVVILGEVMVGSKPWYNVRFEQDGVTLEGYSTSSYIEKTGITITPTPLPEPTATEAPEPTPTLTPAPEITAVPTEAPEVKEDGNNEKEGNVEGQGTQNEAKESPKWIYVVIPVGILIAGLTAYSFYKASKEKKVVVTDQVKRLKDIAIRDKEEESRTAKKSAGGKSEDKIKAEAHKEKTTGNEVFSESETNDKAEKKDGSEERRAGRVRRRKNMEQTESEKVEAKPQLHPEIRVSKNSLNSEYMKRPGVYVKGKASNMFESEEDGQTDEKVLNQEASLREQIEALRTDDVVIHKYFGKGVVCDNSDVRLIAIRFNNAEPSYLDKNQIAAKKLIKICEEERRWRR